jgi:hypothetical protein
LFEWNHLKQKFVINDDSEKEYREQVSEQKLDVDIRGVPKSTKNNKIFEDWRGGYPPYSPLSGHP